MRWLPLEAGSRRRVRGADPWETDDDPIGDGTFLASDDAEAADGTAGYSIRRAQIASGPLALGSLARRSRD